VKPAGLKSLPATTRNKENKMSLNTALTNFTARCRSGVSNLHTARALLLTAALTALFGQPSLFGQPAPLAVPACSGCCAAKPVFTGIYGQIAVATMLASGEGPLGDRDLVVWNISPVYAPVNTDWATQYKDAYYSDKSWNPTNMGDVFGLTLDNGGNIYATATTSYGSSRVGNLANPQTMDPRRELGQVYKIDASTGQPSAFVQLPNPDGAGLGNITYDCTHARFYISNFDDGLIYQVAIDGGKGTFGPSIKQTWDHGANLSSATDLKGSPLSRPNIPPSSASCPGCGQDSLGYAKLGRRPWAVHVYQDRLYYSIWNMDDSQGTSANEIWSVALDATGNFIAPARLEIIMPPLSTTDPRNNPVSDLTFGPKGTMLVAERTMRGDHVPGAHRTRLIEFGWTGSSWSSANLSAYALGTISPYTNSSGGVDFDLTPGAKFQVWGTGDALHFAGNDFIYGLQGFPPGGGSIVNSLLIDLNDWTYQSNKTQIGDVKIPCPQVLSYPSLPVL
jgi:hypothetical protein